MNIDPNIFKAYDVRGIYPSEINEDVARAIGAGFVSYLKANRIAVGRDMRLSSPSIAAAFIDGATSRGADVVDYGMIPTDMLYFAVARDRHDGGVQVTASHNPKQYNGMKMVRQEAFPLSGEEGLVEIRQMIAADTLPPPVARRGQVTTKDALHAYVDHVMAFIDASIVKRRMRETNAIFGGEVTGHYYFRDNFYADNGFIPALLMLELMSRKGQSLHELVQPLERRYFISGEINTKLKSMEQVPAKLTAIAAKYADGHQYTLDGISVEYPDWHFNVRPSNTEPLLRLNLEATTPELMASRRDEVISLIRA